MLVLKSAQCNEDAELDKIGRRIAKNAYNLKIDIVSKIVKVTVQFQAKAIIRLNLKGTVRIFMEGERA